mmetsp:Transcript_23723/g.59934  ORF Transcript_23723/g.59934 Transcript_23723/m.59934 type:complete len:736 (-) Transcript_23723:369-2576(-)|eukprot:g9188.t1
MGCSHSELQQRYAVPPGKTNFEIYEDAAAAHPPPPTSQSGSSPTKSLPASTPLGGVLTTHLQGTASGFSPRSKRFPSSPGKNSGVGGDNSSTVPFHAQDPEERSAYFASPAKTNQSRVRPFHSPEKENYGVSFAGSSGHGGEGFGSPGAGGGGPPGPGQQQQGGSSPSKTKWTKKKDKLTWRQSKLDDETRSAAGSRGGKRKRSSADQFIAGHHGGYSYPGEDLHQQYPPMQGGNGNLPTPLYSEHSNSETMDASGTSSCESSGARNMYTSGLFGVRLENEDFTNLDRRIPRVAVQDQCSEFELLMATDFSRVFRCVWRSDQVLGKRDLRKAEIKASYKTPFDKTGGGTTYRSSKTVVTDHVPPSEVLRNAQGFSKLRQEEASVIDATVRTNQTTRRSGFHEELSKSVTRGSFYKPTAGAYSFANVNVKGVNNGRFFALKEVSKRSPHMEAFTKEVQMLAHLQHRSILRFFGVYLEDPFSLYFLSELCKMDSQQYTEELPRKFVYAEEVTFFQRPFGINCDANDPFYRVTTVEGQAEKLGVRPHWLLRRHPVTGEGLHRSELIHVLRECPLPLTVVFENEDEYNHRLLVLVREFLSAVRYLHEEKKIVHGDLKPGNVLLDMKNRLKLCDFGSAIQVSTNGYLQHCSCGTEGFRAPEITDPGTMGYDGFRADIFSCGKTLDLWTRNPEAKVQWDFSVNPALRWMISEATQETPTLRPKIGYILSSVFDDVPFARQN